MTIALSCRLLYDEALALDSYGGGWLVTNLPAWVDHWPPARVVGGQAERDVARGKINQSSWTAVRHGLLHWVWTQ